MAQQVIIANNLEETISQALHDISPDRLFLLTDEHTHALCKPLVDKPLAHATEIVIGATDSHKNLDTLSQVWQELGEGGATRHSCMVNLGGGMVTDLGGFAAATFKRGIACINIPTTLLAMVDASVGGKTGINFRGLKNEIGAFSDARYVLLNTRFLNTLDAENIRSGYAEMLKHGLISDSQAWSALVHFPLHEPNMQLLQTMVAESVAVKERIVAQDPHERGLRKALNLGHTVGHALESWALTHQPVLHGYAVAWGLVAELYLSAVDCDFPTDRLHQTAQFIREYYGTPAITCDDYPTLLQYMQHDKKNRGSEINFTLLSGIGQIQLDRHVTTKKIEEALDFLREGF